MIPDRLVYEGGEYEGSSGSPRPVLAPAISTAAPGISSICWPKVPMDGSQTSDADGLITVELDPVS